MKLLINKDTTNVTLLIFIQDSSLTTGAGNTGLLATNLTAYYTRVEDDNDVNAVVITLSDLTGTGTVHTDGGLEEIDATNMPGWYRFDIPDAVVATGARVAGIIIIDSGANDVAQVTIEIQLTDVDLEDSVRMGMTALPNAAAEAAGGLYTQGTGAGQINQDANGRIDTNTVAWIATSVTLGAGAPDVNVASLDANSIAAGTIASGELTNIEDEIWDALKSAHVVANSFGDFLDIEVSGRLASADISLTGGAVDTVTTVGTTTTNTDMRGTDSAALASVLGAAVGADISADIAAVKAETVLIVADTGELQGDWVDAGRLDAILDNILTDTGTTLDNHLTDIKGTSFVKDTHSLIDIKTETALIVVDTAEIGVAGVGLSNIPWNASWDTEVESEVNDALDTVISELGVAAPTATPTLRTGLMLLYMTLRNQTIVQTSGTDALEIYNDAGTLIAKKLLTDDGSDYTEAEMVSG